MPNALGVGLGLAPGDSCYDPDHPWYLPNFLHDSAECQCIANQGRPIAEQCASFRGVAETMGGQVGSVVGGVGSGLVSGFGDKLAEDLGKTSTMGLVTVGLIALAGVMVLREVMR